LLKLEREVMDKKSKKKIGIPKKVFKNLEDIFQFEEKLFKEDMESLGVTYTDTKVPKDKYKNKGYFYDPKNENFVYIKPNEPDRDEYISKRNLIPGLKFFTDNLKEIPNKLSENSDYPFRMEIEPIIFKNKGRTPPSVPYLRVYLESSIGDSKSIHFIHNKTHKSSKE